MESTRMNKEDTSACAMVEREMGCEERSMKEKMDDMTKLLGCLEKELMEVKEKNKKLEDENKNLKIRLKSVEEIDQFERTKLSRELPTNVVTRSDLAPIYGGNRTRHEIEHGDIVHWDSVCTECPPLRIADLVGAENVIQSLQDRTLSPRMFCQLTAYYKRSKNNHAQQWEEQMAGVKGVPLKPYDLRVLSKAWCFHALKLAETSPRTVWCPPSDLPLALHHEYKVSLGYHAGQLRPTGTILFHPSMAPLLFQPTDKSGDEEAWKWEEYGSVPTLDERVKEACRDGRSHIFLLLDRSISLSDLRSLVTSFTEIKGVHLTLMKGPWVRKGIDGQDRVYPLSSLDILERELRSALPLGVRFLLNSAPFTTLDVPIDVLHSVEGVKPKKCDYELIFSCIVKNLRADLELRSGGAKRKRTPDLVGEVL